VPPNSSIFVRARRFRQRAVRACSDLDGRSLTAGTLELCEALDGEVRERLQSVPPDEFNQAWGQAGHDLASSLAAATGATPAAVQDSLQASGGDPSMSLLDLLHSTGDSFIEASAAEVTTELHSRRQLHSAQSALRNALSDGGVDPDTAAPEDLAGAFRVLQSQMPADAFLRLLGHCYRPGSQAPLPPRDDRSQDGEEEEAEWRRRRGGAGGGDDDGDDDDGGHDDVDDGQEEDDRRSDRSDREGKKRARDKTVRQPRTGVMVREPKMWHEGKAPDGGYELETFQNVYDDWFSIISGMGRGSGCTFKSRIDGKLVPGVRGNLRLSPQQWEEIGDDELIERISKNLNFNHSDYYHSQMEVLSMPHPVPNPLDPESDDVVSTSYKVLTNKMMYILDQARKNNVKFSWNNVKKTYKRAIRGYTRLERFMDRKDHKSLDAVVSYSNAKLKKRVTQTRQKQHEADLAARAAGARGEIQGGKHEPSDATAPSRGGRGGKRGSRGRGRGGRGGLDERSGIDKRQQHPSNKEREDALAKKLSAAYAKEDALPRGRYWHKRTPFCPAEGSCSAKVCQGCGWHGQGTHWHDRPKCKSTSHEFFVKEGYFHDKYPDKLNAFTDKSASLRTMMGESLPQVTAASAASPAHFRGVSHTGSGSNACAHCAGPSHSSA